MPTTPKKQQKRELTAINFFRNMVGLNSVTLDSKLSKKASAVALIQYKNGYLDHYPAKTKKNCFTKAGAEGSASSNLYLGVTGVAAIGGYMVDPGFNNAAAGHRRWILRPEAKTMGTGMVQYAHALYVTGATNNKNPVPKWIRWPSKGYFPIELEPGGRWSFHTPRSDFDFSKAKVKVTVGKKKLKVRIEDRNSGYGSLTGLVFNVSKLPKVKGKKTVTVKVTVSGMKMRGKKIGSVSYNVKLFKAS